MGQLCLNTRPMDRSEHWIFKHFAEMALESVPENAVIIAQVRNPGSSACTPYCDYQYAHFEAALEFVPANAIITRVSLRSPNSAVPAQPHHCGTCRVYS